LFYKETKNIQALPVLAELTLPGLLTTASFKVELVDLMTNSKPLKYILIYQTDNWLEQITRTECLKKN